MQNSFFLHGVAANGAATTTMHDFKVCTTTAAVVSSRVFFSFLGLELGLEVLKSKVNNFQIVKKPKKDIQVRKRIL